MCWHWWWCKVNAVVYQEILGHFMLPSMDNLFGRGDFLFQQDFAPVPKLLTNGFGDHVITVLDYPAKGYY